MKAIFRQRDGTVEFDEVAPVAGAEGLPRTIIRAVVVAGEPRLRRFRLAFTAGLPVAYHETAEPDATPGPSGEGWRRETHPGLLTHDVIYICGACSVEGLDIGPNDEVVEEACWHHRVRFEPTDADRLMAQRLSQGEPNRDFDPATQRAWARFLGSGAS